MYLEGAGSESYWWIVESLLYLGVWMDKDNGLILVRFFLKKNFDVLGRTRSKMRWSVLQSLFYIVNIWTCEYWCGNIYQVQSNISIYGPPVSKGQYLLFIKVIWTSIKVISPYRQLQLFPWLAFIDWLDCIQYHQGFY